VSYKPREIFPVLAAFLTVGRDLGAVFAFDYSGGKVNLESKSGGALELSLEDLKGQGLYGL